MTGIHAFRHTCNKLTITRVGSALEAAAVAGLRLLLLHAWQVACSRCKCGDVSEQTSIRNLTVGLVHNAAVRMGKQLPAREARRRDDMPALPSIHRRLQKPHAGR